jgi:hypothetical protein
LVKPGRFCLRLAMKNMIKFFSKNFISFESSYRVSWCFLG